MTNQERKTKTQNATNRKGLAASATTLPDPAKPIAEQELSVLLAMCLFGEARGESDLARRAVAQLVLNRARNPRRLFGSKPGTDFAENLRRVILQPWQFSCFNPSDPNRAKLLHPLDHAEPQAWERCLRCAREALRSSDPGKQPPDALTANSDHYFDDSIQPPSWANPAKQTVKIGRLTFYRLYLSPPAVVSLPGLPPSSHPFGDAPAAAPDAPSGSRLNTSLPSPASASAGNIRPSPSRRQGRIGRLASFVAGLLAPLRPLRTGGWRGKLRIVIAAMGLSLLLASCNDLERAAYQTLAVTKAEYQTIQRHVAEATVHGLITEQQWNRFQAAGHRFIDAHNTAADAFALWSRTKSDGDAARLEAMLEILPRLILEINSLVESLEEKPGTGIRDRNPEAGTPQGKPFGAYAGFRFPWLLDGFHSGCIASRNACEAPAQEVFFHTFNGCIASRNACEAPEGASESSPRRQPWVGKTATASAPEGASESSPRRQPWVGKTATASAPEGASESSPRRQPWVGKTATASAPEGASESSPRRQPWVGKTATASAPEGASDKGRSTPTLKMA